MSTAFNLDTYIKDLEKIKNDNRKIKAETLSIEEQVQIGRENTKKWLAIAAAVMYGLYLLISITCIVVPNWPKAEIIVPAMEEFGTVHIIPIVTLVFGYYFGQTSN